MQRIGGVATSSASQPSMMAIMLEQLAARPGDRVLEIGAGHRLQRGAAGPHRRRRPAAVTVGGHRRRPDRLGGPAPGRGRRHRGAAGLRGRGARVTRRTRPYDRIVLTVGSSDVRPEWVAQLAPGGRLLLPLALRGSQLSVALDLGPDGLLRSDSVRGCAFIRLRGVGAAPDTVLPVGAGCSMQVPGGRRAAGRTRRWWRRRWPRPARSGRPACRSGRRTCGTASGCGWPCATRARSGCCFDDDVEPGDDDPARLGSGPAAALFPAGVGYAGLALVGPGPGLALAGPVPGGHRWPRAAGVHAFGPGGAVPAERLVAALAAWDAAGRPRAAELRLVVAPRPVLVEPRPGAVIPLPNAVVTAMTGAGARERAARCDSRPAAPIAGLCNNPSILRGEGVWI